MSSPEHCSQCGAEISAGKQNGLCTRCLLELGLEAEAVSEPSSPSSVPRPPSLGTGASFGDYELLEEIARGGMGVVYKARQVSLDRIVAVKLLLAGALSSPEFVKRFRVEASAAASLQHPNIVTIHEVGVHQGQHFLVMDYVDGPSLAKRVAQQPLPAKRAAAYLKTVAEAVHFAHEHGILHRDLKPSNILLDTADQPRITDFGLAKRFEGDSEVTLSGQLVGSPSYMPPEQAAAKRGKVSRRSDVYGLGATLYHLLTVRAPFQAATLTDTLDQVLNTEPVAPRLLNPAVPGDLETICLKCLEKEPANRYPTALALAEELERYLNGQPVLARPVGPTGKAWRWCGRQPVRAGLIAALIVVCTLGLAGVLWQWRSARLHARQEAIQRHRAEAGELNARRNEYAADMKEVQRALEDGDLGRALELLNKHSPTKASLAPDLRGWEWRYLWARCQSDERFTLCRYSNAVSALAFSPDGKWLAVRREGGAVALWDTVTKRPAAELPGAGPIRALAFSPRTNLLAWGNRDANGAPNVVSLWDLNTQREIARFSHLHKILSIAFSPDAKQMAALAFNGTVRVWDLETRQETRPEITDYPTAPDDNNPGHYSLVTNATATEPIWSNASENYGGVLFSPDGRWLVIGEAKPRIRLIDRTAGKETVIPLSQGADGVTALASSPDSRWLAAGCGNNDHNVHVWDLADLAAGTNVTLAGHSGWITGLAFSPNGQTLASVSDDHTLRLWDFSRKTERLRFQGNTETVSALAWSTNEQDLVTGAADGSVRYWDPAAKMPAPYTVLPVEIWPWGLTFLPDSKTFLTLTRREGVVVKWDTATVTEVDRLPFLGTNHSSMDLSRDGHWLALCDTNGNIQVWDFRERRLVANLVFPGGWAFVVLFSPRGGYLGSCAFISGWFDTKIWTVAGWREVNLQGIDHSNLRELDFSPDERTVAIGYENGKAAWWDLVTRERRHLFDCQDARRVRVRFSPDGRRFATAGLNGIMTLWDVPTQQATPIGRSYRSGLHDLVFSPDSQRLITTGKSPKDLVKFWDVETGRDVATLPGESGQFFHHIGFSPDGNTLFADSMYGLALLWRAPSLEQIEAIEKNGRPHEFLQKTTKETKK